MNPNKALWEKGDFTRIAESMRESGEALVRRLGITKGLKVLDLGCGDGTTAIPAARLGADVLGVDIARNLVEAGKRRAEEQGLTNCKFQEGDASNLHELKDDTFDLVVSIFGAMFAPKPFDVAREIARVTRPGGRIIMGNWIPNDPTLVAQILKISSSYTPPPPEGFISPMTWGIETNVIERFAGAGVPKEKISFVRDTYTFNFPGAPSEFVAEFRNYYGPTMNAFEAAEKNGRAADLQNELEVLLTAKTKAQTRMPPPFLPPSYELLLRFKEVARGNLVRIEIEMEKGVKRRHEPKSPARTPVMRTRCKNVGECANARSSPQKDTISFDYDDLGRVNSRSQRDDEHLRRFGDTSSGTIGLSLRCGRGTDPTATGSSTTTLPKGVASNQGNRAVFSLNNKSGGQLADKFRPFPVASLRFVTNRRFLVIRPQGLYLSHSREISGWWLGRESNPDSIHVPFVPIEAA